MRGPGLPGRRPPPPHPGSGAASSPRLCPAGGRTRARAGSREGAPGGWAEAQADLTPPAPGSPRGAAFAPTPRHLSRRGARRSRDRPSRGTALPAVAQTRRKCRAREDRPARTAPYLSGDEQQPPGAAADAERERRAPGRGQACHGPPRGRRARPGRDPSWEAGAASLAGCGGWPPGAGVRSCGAGLRGTAASSEPPCGRGARRL